MDCDIAGDSAGTPMISLSNNIMILSDNNLNLIESPSEVPSLFV